jgi:hypothetical protein
MLGSRRVTENTRLNSVCPWRIKITLILSSSSGKHEEKPKHFGSRAVEPKTELRRLALERACRDAI